jgi:hypothetical protein
VVHAPQCNPRGGAYQILFERMKEYPGTGTSKSVREVTFKFIQWALHQVP